MPNTGTIYGVVTFFNPDPTKCFGFIAARGLESDVFFHWNDGQRCCIVGDHVDFNPNSTPSRQPKKGDKVAFRLSRGSQGRQKAYPWAFRHGLHEGYDHYLSILAVMPTTEPDVPVLYRILQWFRTVSDGKATDPQVLWTGTNLNELGLDRHYHPKWDRPSGNGDIDWRKDWQTSMDGGKTWQDCSCPSEYYEQFDTRGTRRVTRR